MARFLTDAAGAAQAFRSEMESMIKSRFERLISDFDLVQREEFEAVKAMASKARAENERQAARVAKLETVLAVRTAQSHRSRSPVRKPAGKTEQRKPVNCCAVHVSIHHGTGVALVSSQNVVSGSINCFVSTLPGEIHEARNLRTTAYAGTPARHA